MRYKIESRVPGAEFSLSNYWVGEGGRDGGGRNKGSVGDVWGYLSVRTCVCVLVGSTSLCVHGAVL